MTVEAVRWGLSVDPGRRSVGKRRAEALQRDFSRVVRGWSCFALLFLLCSGLARTCCAPLPAQGRELSPRSFRNSGGTELSEPIPSRSLALRRYAKIS